MLLGTIRSTVVAEVIAEDAAETLRSESDSRIRKLTILPCGYNCSPPERNRMRRSAAVLLIFNLIIPSLAFSADETALVGYSPHSSTTERDWETKFRAIPDPANLKEYMRRLSA